MRSFFRLAVVALAIGASFPALSREGRVRFMVEGPVISQPLGWMDFCREPENVDECHPSDREARDVVLDDRAWKDLARVNDFVNSTVVPLADIDHWGVAEKWSYPTDGYGDCEDYVLAKRKMLTDAGWPRSALLVTVVRDRRDEPHAVLTVKSDRGEFVLDNLEERVLPWTDTGYKFIKRQSQSDPSTWVSLYSVNNVTSVAGTRR